MNLLDELDEEQRAAVLHPGQPLVVEAGAGSGKTRVLTGRIARRVGDGEALARHVLAVTFTRKAAGELRERLARLGVTGVAAGTFHSLAWAQMRRYWQTRSLDAPSEVIERKAGVLAPLLLRRRGPARGAEPRDVAAEIEWAKVRLLRPDGYAAAARHRRPPLEPEEIADIYAAYEDAKRRRNALDFEDMLSRLVEAASRDVEFAAELRSRHRHVFVDEFQDTSPLGHAVLRTWTGPAEPADLFVVGDPRQAIYSFSGADSRFISDFERHWRGATRLRLTSNYRSRPAILAISNALMASARTDRRPPLRPTRDGGDLPEIISYADERAEAAGIARVLRRHAFDGRGWHSAAVLYRTNAQSAALEAALADAAIPYRVRGDRAFLKRPEVRRALTALTRRESDLTSVAVPAVIEGQRASLDDEASANLDVLLGLCEEYAETGGPPTVGAFLEWLTRTASGDESASSDAVELVTLHRAKGLEWDVVVVAGCEAGLLPIGFARLPSEVDEERRVFHVGITRPRERLVLTHSERRHGQRGTRGPSPFLEPLGAALDALRRGTDPASDWHALLRMRSDAELHDPSMSAELRAWRSRVAGASGVPAYVVFSDATLEAIARSLPRTPSQLLAVEGIGPVKLERYGAQILEIVRGAAPAEPKQLAMTTQARAVGLAVGLAEELRRWRTETARRESFPAYRVFRDATLDALVERQPRTKHELLAIEGIGPAKLERYGNDLLSIIASAHLHEAEISLVPPTDAGGG